MRVVPTLLVVFLACTVHAQHAYTNTLTVDPTNGKADFDSIQEAIDSLTSPSVRTTISIYAGEYAEEITLGSDSDNIDLVGVDATPWRSCRPRTRTRSRLRRPAPDGTRSRT